MLYRIGLGLRAVIWASPLLLLAACQVIVKHSDSACDDGSCEPPAAAIMPWKEPKLCHEPSMHAMACDLDHLEKHIDWYGSVTAKTPDVWGQARLTQYREDFEKEMYKELTAFNAGIQGSVARTDQAFLSSSVALSMAAQPKPPLVGTAAPKSLAPATRDTVVVQDVTTTVPATKDTPATTTKDTATTTTKEAVPAAGTPPTPVTPLQLADLNKEMTELKSALTQNKAELLKVTTSKQFEPGIGIEPTLLLAQKKRYLDFLNQLRRENEGDDTADSPGYSLNLIRVPVSVLPGTHTDKGYGAEVTMTLAPILGDDLLPMTMRNFVINDLADQIGIPLAMFLDRERMATSEKERYLTEDVQLLLQYLEAKNQEAGIVAPPQAFPPVGPPTAQPVIPMSHTRQVGGQKPVPVPPQRDPPVVGDSDGKKRVQLMKAADKFNLTPLKVETQSQKSQQDVQQMVADKINVPRLSYASGLNQRQAFPTSQLTDVYGIRYSFEIAYGAQLAFQDEIAKTGYVHLPNIQGYLREELVAAYQFLARPENQDLWRCFCTEEIVSLIRSQQWEKLLHKRGEYRDQVMMLTGSNPLRLNTVKEGDRVVSEPNDVSETRQVSRTSALAWCILVDAALLTDRLIKDMKQTATSKGKYAPDCDVWRDYYHPNPSPEARQAFNEYVALRWPIRVFALDPATQDQNVTDTYSGRREMQLALAIAFTNGMISANTMSKYARRLELDAQTIALNRPQIGFGHGENVFGWRFTPRFQTPDTRSNLTVFVRDQLIGGPNRDQLLRERRLEPGMRECVAVVMMPSFVPYMQLDTTGNWFALANPKHKKLDHTQALHLSRTVQTIKNESCSVRDAVKYREGEYDRLRKRAEQLEARLPTQTIVAPVPVLNTLGGFEMFSNGTTDLAPELYGWYGAPGIDPEADNTALFLVGDHFSPLRSRVIVGNQEIDPMKSQQKMLSRQVMQIVIPRGSYVTDGKEVRVHMATPYGVTRELAVPVVSKVKKAEATKPTPPEGYTLGTEQVRVRYWQVKRAASEGKFDLQARDGLAFEPILIGWKDAVGSAPATLGMKVTFQYKSGLKAFDLGDVTATPRGYLVDGKQIDQLARGVIAWVNEDGPFTLDSDPLANKSLKSLRVTLTPKETPPRAAQPTDATNQIELVFVPEVKVPVVPPPAPTPPAGAPKTLDPVEAKKHPAAAPTVDVPLIKLQGANPLGAEPLPLPPASLPPVGGK